MLGALSAYERTNEPQDADIIIVNTCGFIASAKKESIDRILEVALVKKDDAILLSTFLSKNTLIIAHAIAIPALGPSFGVAPSGTWTWMS